MPSSYTTSARFTLQATGENNNTWGVILNSGVFQLVDDNVNGRLAFPLSGAKALTTVLGATDEARMAFLDVTGGSGGTVTIPAVSKGYFVRNGSAGDVTISAGGPTNATFNTGDAGPVFSSGSAVYPSMIGGKTVKKYVDDLFSSVPVALPPVAGKAGMFLGNDGVNTLAWQTSTPLQWSFGGVASTGTVYITTSGGAAPPPISATTLISATANGQARVEINCFAGSPLIVGRGANGTSAAPTATVTGNTLLGLTGRGYGATGYSASGRVAVTLEASENWTDAAQGASIVFQTTPNGTIAAGGRWRVAHDGHFRPEAGNTYDIGSPTLPIKNLHAAAQITVNLGPGPIPAPIAAAPILLGIGPNGGSPVLELISFGGTSRFTGRHSNGTAAAPTPTKAGDAISAVSGQGRGTTAWSVPVAGQMYFMATEDWTDTAHGTAVRFQSTPNGAALPALRWEIAHDGHFLPGAANTYDIGSPVVPLRNVYAGSAAFTGAVPTGPDGSPLQTSRLPLAVLTTPIWLSQFQSGSLVRLGVGGDIHANTPAQFAIPDGFHTTIINFAGVASVITQEPGATLLWVNPAGAALTGSRTLAPFATVQIFASGNTFSIMGTGIT